MAFIQNLALVGCGKMGSAMLLGILHAHPQLRCFCCDVNPDAIASLKAALAERGLATQCTFTESLSDLRKTPEAVIIAVKPAQVMDVIKKVSQGREKLIISIAAGIPLERLQAAAVQGRIVRVMPNAPALIGAGVSVYYKEPSLSAADEEICRILLSSIGEVHAVENEALMHAVTALSGSAPALFAMMADALADAAVAEGLPRSIAAALARSTMEGSAKLLAVQTPQALKDSVMSPAGTTAAGVKAAEIQAFRAASMAFVEAAAKKSREMS